MPAGAPSSGPMAATCCQDPRTGDRDNPHLPSGLTSQPGHTTAHNSDDRRGGASGDRPEERPAPLLSQLRVQTLFPKLRLVTKESTEDLSAPDLHRVSYANSHLLGK